MLLINSEWTFLQISNELDRYSLSGEVKQAVLDCLWPRQEEVRQSMVQNTAMISNAVLKDFDWKVKVRIAGYFQTKTLAQWTKVMKIMLFSPRWALLRILGEGVPDENDTKTIPVALGWHPTPPSPRAFSPWHFLCMYFYSCEIVELTVKFNRSIFHQFNFIVKYSLLLIFNS